MKKCFTTLLRISVLLLSIFAMVKTNVKAENKVSYVTMLKENNTIEKEVQEAPQETHTVEIEETKEEIHENNKKLKKKSSNSGKKTVSKQETKQNTKTINYGTFGRLYVSSYNVSLYDYNVNTSSELSLQTLVDNKDSAAYYKNRGKLVIADHYNQGFSILAKVHEGSTAYIKFEDGSEIKYKMIKKTTGTNTGPDLVDEEGNSVFNLNSDIIMYTCYNGGILITLWVLT